MFSSGTVNTTIAVAELFRELGHTVELVHANSGSSSWWTDCNEMEKSWVVRSIESFTQEDIYDVLFEIGILQFPPEIREKVAKKVIWIVRSNFVMKEIEESVYPKETTMKRSFDGLSETWVLDAIAKEDYDLQVLELLTRAPVRMVPYIWTPTIAKLHLANIGNPSWIQQSANALKEVIQSSGTRIPWSAHICETNSTNMSSCIVPIVILKEAENRGFRIEKWIAHNAEVLKDTKFFVENTLKLCESSKMTGVCVGRQRTVDWVTHPLSCVVSHIRFTRIRPALLDLAWAGVPLIHNSLFLRDLGFGLERTFYNGNRIGEACDAFGRLEDDLKSLKGCFSQETLTALRNTLEEKVSPWSKSIQERWSAALGSESKEEKVVKAEATPKKETIRIGFCDMWENFNPAYNFFTLLLSEYLPTHTIVGEAASPDSNLVIFGPFGFTWKSLPQKQPKVFFTGENTGRFELPGVDLYLTFEESKDKGNRLRFPLWYLYIDWFKATYDILKNPKPIDLLDCIRVKPNILEKKDRFCAFVVSNPSNSLRNNAFEWLSEYKQVDSAGMHLNTMGPILQAGQGGGGGEREKVAFLRTYKYCITYENSSSKGYTTEKYLHAKAAGCVPIYWGDPDVSSEFDISGCIIAQNIACKEDLIRTIEENDMSDVEYMKKARVPALTEKKVKEVRQTMAEAARRIAGLLGIPESPLWPKEIGLSYEAAMREEAPIKVKQAPILTTYVNHRVISSLKHWLTAIETQISVFPELNAIVFLEKDVPEGTREAFEKNYSFVKFERVPEDSTWACGWIYKTLCMRESFAERMVLFMDVETFMCRWPVSWIQKAEETDLCFLESEKRLQKNMVCFRAGSSVAKTLFSEAHSGEEILNTLSYEKNCSILSANDYISEKSLRETFITGKSMYMHRGRFTVTIPFAKGINEAYLVNLKRRPDRLEKVWASSPELKDRVKVFEAVDGNSLKLTPAIARFLKPNDFFWKKGVAGCALSHLQIWYKLLMDTPDIKNYMVLEDDVKFLPDWETRWNAAVDAGEVPESYDILYLGGLLPPNREMFLKGGRERYNNSFSKIALNQHFHQKEPNRFCHFCTYAYVLSKRGAKKLMELFEGMGGCWTSIDHVMCNPVDIFETYVFDPLLAGCYQDDDPSYTTSKFNDFSRVDKFDSDIWNNNDRFSQEEIQCMSQNALDIPQVIKDLSTKEIQIKEQRQEQRQEQTKETSPRIVSLQPYDKKTFYEAEWFSELLGFSKTFDCINPFDAPPTDSPIVIYGRGTFLTDTIEMLKRWNEASADFHLLHVSDEFLADPIDVYGLPACKSVVRMYVRDIPPEVQEKVQTIPLGYHWPSTAKECPDSRAYDISFVGTNWHSRKELLSPLFSETTSLRVYSKFFDTWLDSNSLPRESYLETLKQSIFVPCPDGQNAETYRFYEALESGAIPLLVETERNKAFIKQIKEQLPILVTKTWVDAKGFVEGLLKREDLLKKYRDSLMAAWAAWKQELSKKVSSLYNNTSAKTQ
jgi:GR25 family glycosyltransferase involved in LPS biosynthesis